MLLGNRSRVRSTSLVSAWGEVAGRAWVGGADRGSCGEASL